MAEQVTISISLAAKSKLDKLKSQGQSYDSIIKKLVKFWKEQRMNYWTRRRRRAHSLGIRQSQ